MARLTASRPLKFVTFPCLLNSFLFSPKMTKKKSTLILIPILLLALAVILFGPALTGDPVTMPISPDRVTHPGKYDLDDTRFVEIKEGTEGLEYWEGHQQPDDTDSISPRIVSYSATEIQSVRLDAGWAIEFTPPDQLFITLRTGEIIQRTFGKPQANAESELPSGNVVKRQSLNHKEEPESGE